MRSRYSAYVERDRDYILRTWHPRTRPVDLNLDQRQRWLGLKIIACNAGAEQDDQGSVEFVARYKIDGRGFRLHEVSSFVRYDGRWHYLSGELKPR